MLMQTRDESRVPAAAQPRWGPGAAKLRVLHVVTRLGQGGTEYGVLKVMAGLDHDLFEHRICATRGFDPDFPQLRQLEDRLFSAGTREMTFQFPLFRLMRIMKFYRPHIVHSRNWGALEAVPAARLAGVPVVIHSEHGYELDMFPGLPLRRRLFRRAAYAMADSVFTVTRELKDYHARQAWVSRDRIQVIYNGVDTQRFAPRLETRLRLRQELGLPAESFVVGTVGRMVPIKDHGTLLKAAEVLAQRGVDVRLLLVGTGPELARLQRQASGTLAGRVCFVGASERVPELLNTMDVFVLPSLGEGMSNTLLEAMACGLPLLATRVGGNPEVVENEESSWLFSPGDVSGLAERLSYLAYNPELLCRLGMAARRRAVEVFSLERMVQNYRSLYLQVAELRGVATLAVDMAHVRN